MDWIAFIISLIVVAAILLVLAILYLILECLGVGGFLLLIMVSVICYIGVSTYFLAKMDNMENDKRNHANNK